MNNALERMTIGAAIVAAMCLSGCASWGRFVKGWNSEWSDGMDREVIVYDINGDELFRQTGKFDIEYSDERILYDDENDMRHVIYFKTGTVVVNEIGQQ